MPLFGRNPLAAGQRAGFTPAPKPQERLPQPNAQRRGLFGRMAQSITPDRLMIVGQTLRDIGEGTNGLPDLIEQQRMRPWLEEEMQGRRMDRKREQRGFEAQDSQRVRSQLLAQQYIAGLPPEQQQQAMLQFTLDPDGFAERIQGPQFEARPGMTHTTAIDPYSGHVTQGDALPLRPRAGNGAAAGAPPLPNGFVWAD